MARSRDYDNDYRRDRGYDRQNRSRRQDEQHAIDEYYFAYCPDCDADTPHSWDECQSCEQQQAIQRLKDTEDKADLDEFGKGLADV